MKAMSTLALLEPTYLGFGRGASPFFRQQKCQCVSSCTVHSSPNTTSSKWQCKLALANSSCFVLLLSRISWQYEIPQYVQPNKEQQRRTVHGETKWPLSARIFWSSLAVVSSPALICPSTNWLTASATFEGLPGTSRRTTISVSSYFTSNLWIKLKLEVWVTTMTHNYSYHTQ